MLTQGELRNQIEYDPETGLWRWRSYRVNRKTGWFAGAANPNGYLTIRIDGKTYYAHQLAWLWFHGELVTHLDHKDRVRGNNRLENLRPANKSLNAVNSQTRSDNTSGVRGVSFQSSNGRWHGYINKDGQRVNKYFGTKEEAESWVIETRKRLFGEFVPKVVSSD